MEHQQESARKDNEATKETRSGNGEPVSVYSLMVHTSYLFAELAYQRMGLVSDPQAGKVVRDMDQAKAAVDAVTFLAETAMPRLDEAVQREVRNLVTNLRINFAKQSQPDAQVEQD